MNIIAEIGQNHNGDMALAKELVILAKKNGADVAKFQLFDAKSLFSKKDNPWYEYNLKTELSYDQIKMLKDFCDSQKIEFMASVFDEERIGWLEELEVERYKIASRSIFDTDLIDAVLKTNKPTIISLGLWDKDDLPKFIGNIEGYLYCISKYPTKLDELNLSKVSFEKYIGFSDHTVGINASCCAIARGAKIIEKHFTIDKGMYGPDHGSSITPVELAQLRKFSDDISLCL
ncbi:MAG: hypothetical protein CMG07_05215 [Candidatus Marinimicrobia bacterium]|nr:hypothetical protein [Candidatus Neomarinimicrobiota bacterium]